MCALLERGFTQIMTDVVAIRRDLLTCDMLEKLSGLKHLCTGKEGLCVFRRAKGWRSHRLAVTPTGMAVSA